MTTQRSALRRVALFAGGFIGPFAGLMTSSILPELGASFGIDAEAAAVSLMAYLIPFALTLLVSGWLGQRWGINRMLRIAYAVFAFAAVVCALAPIWEVFLLGYMLAGFSNAFTTPLILGAIGKVFAGPRLGRSLGLYSSLAACGQLSAPLFSGLLAVVSWRYAFACVAVIALLLCIIGTPKVAEEKLARSVPHNTRARRIRIDPGLIWASTANISLGLCIVGTSFLIALFADLSFGSGSTERGLILMCGGVASLLFAQVSGAAVDRWRPRPVIIVSMLVGALAVAAVPLAGNAVWLAVLWALAMGAGQAANVGVNKHVLGFRNGGAMISIASAFRFFGFGLSPLLILPLFEHSAGWAFHASATILGVTAVMLLLLARRVGPGKSESQARAVHDLA